MLNSNIRKIYHRICKKGNDRAFWIVVALKNVFRSSPIWHEKNEFFNDWATFHSKIRFPQFNTGAWKERIFQWIVAESLKN